LLPYIGTLHLLPYYSTTLDRHYYSHDETVAWVTDKCLPVKNDFEKGTSLLEAPRRNRPLEATGIGEFTLMPTFPLTANVIDNAMGGG
jgi:hypothetical protein